MMSTQDINVNEWVLEKCNGVSAAAKDASKIDNSSIQVEYESMNCKKNDTPTFLCLAIWVLTLVYG